MLFRSFVVNACKTPSAISRKGRKNQKLIAKNAAKHKMTNNDRTVSKDRAVRILPAFGMVFLKTGVEEVVVELLRTMCRGEDRSWLGLLLEVLDISRGVSPLKRSEVSGAPVLALP
jgi:hypothetical protein